MTRVQGWLITLVAVAALAVAALLATAGGGFAQEGSPTPTEAPSATAAPGGDGSDKGSRDGCPEKERDASTETQTEA
jgi:hypothetical protein